MNTFYRITFAASLVLAAPACDSGECGTCTLPPFCGQPASPCSCGCRDGQVFEDGTHVCKNGCLEPIETGGNGGAGGGGGNGGSGGANCKEAPIGKLCVRGEIDPQSNQEVLTAGGKVLFQLYPKGCFSSSCTIIHEASCLVVAGTSFSITGSFCLEGTSAMNMGCTPDCSGGGFASCEDPSVDAGMYTASIDGLSVSFEVPSSLPFGGVCSGDQF
jgi:hypothetical protein